MGGIFQGNRLLSGNLVSVQKRGERLTCREEMCIMKSYGITMNMVRLRNAGQEDM